jgi:hypothetical protein
MTSIVRKIVNGIWETVAADDAGGGGGAQPSVTDGVTTIAAASALVFPTQTLSEPTPGTAQIDHLVQSATVTLGHADILALPTIPFEVVPAPVGDNQVILPLYVLMVIAIKTAGYTNVAANADLAFQNGLNNLTIVSQASGVQTVSDLLGQDGRTWFLAVPPRGSDTTVPETEGLLSGAYNTALTLESFNGANGDFTGGDAADAIIVSVLYAVLTLPT